ncbi:MAG: HEPN domain-containing protein [Chloroflexota bacterium]
MDAEHDNREWLVRAEYDLLVAMRALERPLVLSEAASFHAEQAAEKALKGYLAAQGEAVPVGHDLVDLLRLCQAIDPEFAQLEAAVEALGPHFAAYTEPGAPTSPLVVDAERDLEVARGIVQFVRVRV